MNTYDFDKTIFYPDSSATFIKFCLRKKPALISKTLISSLGTAILYLVKRTNAKTLKEKLFSFLPSVDNLDELVSEFWAENEYRLESWYLRQKEESDIIISASPEFLLAPICEKLKVRLIATRMEKESGKIIGENCHDIEKVKRFYESFPNAHTEKFYSDSLTDTPMAKIADKAFLVKKNIIREWIF